MFVNYVGTRAPSTTGSRQLAGPHHSTGQIVKVCSARRHDGLEQKSRRQVLANEAIREQPSQTRPFDDEREDRQPPRETVDSMTGKSARSSSCSMVEAISW